MDRVPFVGRAGERAVARDAVDGLVEGRGGALVVEGEAGIGKSRLLADALAGVHGVALLRGQARELERARPFGALVEALGPAGWSPRASDGPYRAVETLLAAVEACALDGPVALTVEDLHWADPLTLQDGNVPGPGVVPVVDTPYGRIATIICFDADLPWLARQAGRAGADLLLVPARDWQPIAETHARMAVLRAVENGAALVRPTGEGVTLAVDHQGRSLGHRADFFVADEHTMLADVPMRGSWTPYRFVGEGFAMASTIGLVVLAVAAATRRRSPSRGGRD